MLDSLPAVAVKPAEPARHLLGQRSVTNRIVWRYAIPIVTIHLLALAALVPWLFSWTGVVLLVAGIYVYGRPGDQHRLSPLAHPSQLQMPAVVGARDGDHRHLLLGRRAGQLGGDPPLAP